VKEMDKMDPAEQIYNAYKQLLSEGKVQKAYRSIIQFMVKLQIGLKTDYPNFEVSGVYQGYMDMTYFSFTPPALSALGLKIAIVFLHESFTFQVWLSARNRQLRGKFINLLRQLGWNPAEISTTGPGIDSVVENVLVSEPDFEDPLALSDQILAGSLEFSSKIEAILSGKGSH
jgi:hypothetical protein